MTRGLVLGLTPEQVVQRALYLASAQCSDIYYRLEYPNGGNDPTALDPASRWSKPGSTFVNRTSDCVGGAAWCGGWDRWQPKRFKLWDGWINCDSILIDVLGKAICFELVERPFPGCMVVYSSADYDHDGQRDRIGHVGTVVEVPAEWDPKSRECWKRLGVVDIAARTPQRANQRTSGLTWWGNDRRGVAKNSRFVRCVMRP